MVDYGIHDDPYAVPVRCIDYRSQNVAGGTGVDLDDDAEELVEQPHDLLRRALCREGVHWDDEGLLK